MIYDSIYDWFYETIEYLLNIFFSLTDFVFENKFIFSFVFVPIIASCLIVIVDMLFDIRDLFGYSMQFWDLLPKTKVLIYNKFSKKNNKDALNMDEVYQRSKAHADYKHQLKMEEAREFRKNENIRHQNRVDEFNMFPKNKTSTKTTINTDFSYIPKGNDVQGFVNYIKEFEPKTFDREMKKQERQVLMDNYFLKSKLFREREQVYSDSLKRKKNISLDVEFEDDI